MALGCLLVVSYPYPPIFLRMNPTLMTTTGTEAAIWERVIHPEGQLTPGAARAILQLEFPRADRQRLHALALRAQEGQLSSDEEAEIDNYERVGTMLSILQSKARKVLKRTPSRRSPKRPHGPRP